MCRRRNQIASLILALALACLPCLSQAARPAKPKVEKFPYTLTNFVWWNDADLRTILKSRIPGLSDEIGRDSAFESKIRTTLVQLLHEKGIEAEVQSLEPALNASAAIRVPEAPPLSIAFSIATPPRILVGAVTFEGAPTSAMDPLLTLAAQMQGKPFDSNGFWYPQMQIKGGLSEAGYLSASAQLHALPPRKDGDQYVVPLLAVVQPGPQYHVAAITADGGPLIQDQDLSCYFTVVPGDAAKPNPFGQLIGVLQSVYWRAGYADVAFQGDPKLDTDHALASYALQVIPGSIYHLRTVSIENLDPVLQDQFRNFINLAPGDIYDGTVFPTRERMIAAVPELKGYGFGFSPRKDKVEHMVDLTFHFYKD